MTDTRIETEPELCPEDAACPCCGNREMDELLWGDDDSLTCCVCQCNYWPE